MSNIRFNGTVGIVEYTEMLADKESSLHFSEWWNGEGLDFEFGDKSVSLHIDEMNAMVTAMIMSGAIDVDECKQEAEKILEKSKKQQRYIDMHKI